MPENIQNHTLKEYVDSLINAKLIAILNRLGGNGIDEDMLRDILADIPMIDWMDKNTFLTMATENDRYPDVLDRKIQAGNNVVMTTGDELMDEHLLVSAIKTNNLIDNPNRTITDRLNMAFPFAVGTPTISDFFYDRWQLEGIVNQTMTLNQYVEGVEVSLAPVAEFSAGEYVVPFKQGIYDTVLINMAEGNKLALSMEISTNFDGTILLELHYDYNNTVYRIPVDVVAGVTKISETIDIPVGFFAGIESDLIFNLMIGGIDELSNDKTHIGTWGDPSILRPNYLTKWYMTQGNYIRVKNIQLEIADKASEFVPRPRQLEELLCKRFYGRYYINEIIGVTSSYSQSNPNSACPYAITIRPPIRMAGFPTTVVKTGEIAPFTEGMLHIDQTTSDTIYAAVHANIDGSYTIDNETNVISGAVANQIRLTGVLELKSE